MARELAGGFVAGDRVFCAGGAPATVLGPPARRACAAISVAVRYDGGRVADERVSGITKQAAADRSIAPQREPPPAAVRQGAPPPDSPRDALSDEPGDAEPEEAPLRLPLSNVRSRQPAAQPEPRRSERGDPGPAVAAGQGGGGGGPGLAGRPVVPPLNLSAGEAWPEVTAAEGPYGIGRRILADRRAPKPLGGEIEAGYGIGNRSLPDRHGDGRRPADEEEEDAGPRESAAEAAEAILEDKLRRNYSSLHDAFRALDRTNNGWVSRSDFLEAVTQVLQVGGLGPADVDEVAEHFGLRRGGVLSYAEFAALLDGPAAGGPPEPQEHGARVVETDLLLEVFKQAVDQRFSSYRSAFRALDKNHDASMSPGELAGALRQLAINAADAHVDALYRRFDPDGVGRVTFAAFCRALSDAPQFEAHLKRQMFHSRAPVAE